MIIYKITNKIDGNIYIGQTVNTLSRRMACHYAGNQKGYIASAFKKHGRDRFSVEVIGKYNSIEDLNNAEEYFIEFFNSMAPNGYNLITGGRNRIPSEETRKKLSDSHKGYKHSKEALRKMSLSGKGRRQSLEHAKKRADAKRGKPHSEKSKLQMSLARKGIPRGPFSEGHKARISAGKIGKSRPDMFENKFGVGRSPANKGKKFAIVDGKRTYI
jgi:group I intron endonuclease